MNIQKNIWKRNNRTTEIVEDIRHILKILGYDEELAIVPLLKSYSVLVRKDEKYINIIIDKATLVVLEKYELTYHIKKEMIKKITRNAI
jgi:hypothetical protein